MKLPKQKRMENTLSQEPDFVIPQHWISAAKIAKKVLQEFKNKVSVDTFLSWNHYKKFDYVVNRKIPIYIVIRHTKHWSAECVTIPGKKELESGCIRINLDNDTISKDELKNIDDEIVLANIVSHEYFYQTLFGTLVHELIHFFQDCLGLEDKLPVKEKKKLVLNGNSFSKAKNNFLYATNWVEMDAELGSYFAQHSFQVPTLKQLIDYFNEWYYDRNLASVIGSYIYDYFILGKKNLAMREAIFKGKRTI